MILNFLASGGSVSGVLATDRVDMRFLRFRSLREEHESLKGVVVIGPFRNSSSENGL